jgi:two-component system sensor histidine kinase SenX3
MAVRARRGAQRQLEAALALVEPELDNVDGPSGVDDIVGAIGDVLRRSERRVKSAELVVSRLSGALDQLSQGVVVVDTDALVVYRNAEAANLSGGRADDVLAEQALSEGLAAALEGDVVEKTLELFSPQRRTLVIRSRPLRAHAQSDELVGAVAVIDDVSGRRRLDDVRRDFVANVSHELKTPVGALSLLAETLDGEDDPEIVARLSSRVAAEAERLGRIIDDLLDLSRIESNESPSSEAVDMDRLVSEVVEPLRRHARGRDIEITLNCHSSGLSIPGDRRDLVSAVSNLVDNAIKYSEPGGHVTVDLRCDDGWVDVAVTDQGIGIPARDRERIFERFYRVDRARSRSTGGTGLGLAIVRHVAVNHGGSVSVQSVEGEGSTFTLRLPTKEVTDA